MTRDERKLPNSLYQKGALVNNVIMDFWGGNYSPAIGKKTVFSSLLCIFILEGQAVVQTSR